MNKPGHLSDELYKTVTDNMPISCVDMIPVRQVGDEYQVGVITRATGSQKGLLAVLGGRIKKNEFVADAMARHLQESFGDGIGYRLLPANPIERPFRLQEYAHADSAEPPLCFDPSKHSVALNYLITLVGEPVPTNEASEFHWLTESEVPEHAAYNQQVVMQAAFDFLKS